MGAPSPTMAAAASRSAGVWGRLSAALLFCLLISGCKLLGGNSWQVIKIASAERFTSAIPDLEQIDALPYAQMRVSGLEREALLVLGNDDDGRLSWYSADKAIVFTRNGHVVGTHGVGAGELLSMETEGLPENLLAISNGQQTVRRFDWMPGYRFGVEVKGEWQRTGMETVVLLGTRSHQLLRLEEQLTGPGIKARNVFWIDPVDGYIWKSRQWVSDGVSLEMTVLKPYRSGAHW